MANLVYKRSTTTSLKTAGLIDVENMTITVDGEDKKLSRLWKDFEGSEYDKMNKTKTWYAPLTEVFDGTGIEIQFIDDWKYKIGKTWFVHPLAYRSGILATADKAKDFLQDTERESFDAVVMAHTHSIGDSERGYIRLIEQGAFCDVDRMRYADGKLQKPQKKGFAVICQDKNGNLIKDKTKVISLN